MLIVPSSNCIKCCFNLNPNNELDYAPTKVEVFFAEIGRDDSKFSFIKKYVSNDELRRATRFYSDIERETYIFCHGFLRFILGVRLNLNPIELLFIKGINNKPGLKDNIAYFNIAHSRKAFAIAFVSDFHVGIDLENIKQNIDINTIIDHSFSQNERNFILDSKEESMTRFFLLWTRKESLLKAIGAGIIDKLRQVNVSEPINFIKKESFDNLICDYISNEYYIYSLNLSDYLISVALPQKCSIILYNLNEENFPCKD